MSMLQYTRQVQTHDSAARMCCNEPSLDCAAIELFCRRRHLLNRPLGYSPTWVCSLRPVLSAELPALTMLPPVLSLEKAVPAPPPMPPVARLPWLMPLAIAPKIEKTTGLGKAGS